MVLANGVGLYLADLYIPGVEILRTIENLILAAFILALINTFLRPILKFVLTPVIIITFGLANVIVSALTIYLLDYLFPAITISGLLALILTAILVGVINMILGLLMVKNDK